MKILRLVTFFIAILLAVPQIANADTIDFTGINLGAVASLPGQTFAYTNASDGATGMVTVLLVSGSPSAVQTGSTPDTTGFYALQTSDDLTPMVFRFTFDVTRSFTITQNEYLADLEVNSFTLPLGAWNLMSMAYSDATTNGSTLTFVGQNGSPPYGTFVIAGTGMSFDFSITNAPGYPEYGSAISIDVGPVTEPPTLTLFPASTFSTNTGDMDHILGVSGYTIESFETTNLIDGLTITYEGEGFDVTNSSLPQLNMDEPGASSFAWDGMAFVSNDPSNGPPASGTWPSLTTFNYAPGAASMGIGLGGFQSTDPPSDQYPITNHRIYINGLAMSSDLETLAGTNWTGSAFGRDVYIRVDAAPGNLITSIGFENITVNPGNDDVLCFDHLAVLKPIPILQISGVAPSQVMLSWSNSAASYLLESASTLSASSWKTVTNAQVTAGNLFTVTVNATSAQQFFRLHKQTR